MAEQEEEKPEKFFIVSSFEVLREEVGDKVILRDIQKSNTTDQYSARIISDCDLNKDDRIITIYLKGDVWQHPTDPTIQTAKGRCIYFVYDLKELMSLLPKMGSCL